LARVEGEPSAYEIDADLLQALSLDPLFYRDRTVLSLEQDSIRALTVVRPGSKQAVERSEEGEFRAVGVTDVQVDVDAVGDVMGLAHTVRVVRFVEEDPADLARFGLAEPSHLLTFGLTGEAGIEKTLLLGSDAGDRETYAMIRGEDVVFVLDAALRDVLERDLYAPLSPATE
jgi:hypothetical protein